MAKHFEAFQFNLKFFFHILRFFEHHVPSAWHWDYSNYASYNWKHFEAFQFDFYIKFHVLNFFEHHVPSAWHWEDYSH